MAHTLASIVAYNFRSIKQHAFILSDYTPLVGYNNAGKTNILRAVKWLLRKSSLSADYFYSSDLPIEVHGRIDGINDELLNSIDEGQRKSLLPYLVNGSMEIKRVQLKPFDTAANIKLFVKNPNSKNEDDFWKPNPNGIDQALTNLFPEPIHIGAMENAEDDVSKSKSTSTIGKLLAEIIAPIEKEHGGRVKKVLKGFQDLLDAEGEHRAPELSIFEGEMNKKIDDFFPNVKVKLHIPTPELKEVFGKGTIKVYEEGNDGGRDVASFGHGAQRSIQMALIRYLAELKRFESQPKTRTLLLIDEPELYLHPQAIEVIKDALKKLSSEGYQIVFSTHSAMMLTHEDVGNTVLVRKTKEHGTYSRRTIKSAIEHMEKDATSQLHLLFSLGNASNILFSERVILTEGRTEERVMPLIMQALLGKTLGLIKCALVKQGGVANTRKCLLVLQVMDIPAKAIADLDFIKQAVVDGYIPHDDSDINTCKALFKEIAAAHECNLDAEGWPAKGGKINAAKAFSHLAAHKDAAGSINNLHAKLKIHNIWIWRKGCIEDHLGLTGKEERIWAGFVNRFANEEAKAIITDYDEVLACAKWITT